MNPKAIADIDKEIGQLEKQLASLYTKRVNALEAEIKRYKAQAEAFGGSTSQAPEAAAAKAPAVQPVKRKGKPTRKQPVKAKSAPSASSTDAPKAAKVEEPEAQPVQGAPAAAPKKAPSRKAKQPKTRTRTPTAVVEKRILDAVTEAGLFGISQIDISKKTGLGYQTVVKKLKELKNIEKKGTGKEGRFFIKA